MSSEPSDASDAVPALHRRSVHAELDGLVAGIVGFDADGAAPVARRQPAGSLVPVVISFDGGVRIRRDDEVGAGIATASFVAGLTDTAVATVASPVHRCVQAYLTPIGVRQVLGVDGADLAGRVVEVDDVVAELGAPLVERLRHEADWPSRLSIVEEALRRASRRGRPVDDVVAMTWHQVAATGGRVGIGDLVERSGWSHRHVASRFRRQVGLTPKTVAGVVRFERAAADLDRAPLAEVAARHGYADQSHLTRSVVRFSGETPTALRDARRPTAHTAIGDG